MKKEHDHDGVWLTELLEYHLNNLSPREKTLNLKLSKGSAKLLIENLKKEASHYKERA